MGKSQKYRYINLFLEHPAFLPPVVVCGVGASGRGRGARVAGSLLVLGLDHHGVVWSRANLTVEKAVYGAKFS